MILEPVKQLSLDTFVAITSFLFAVYEYILKTKNEKAPNRHPVTKIRQLYNTSVLIKSDSLKKLN